MKSYISALVTGLFLIGCGTEQQDPPSQIAIANTEVKIVPVTKEPSIEKAPPHLQPCVNALLNTHISIRQWEKGLTSSCLPLSDAEQIAATEAATQQSNQSLKQQISFIKPSAAMGEFARGKLPYLPTQDSEAEEWLALQGNYQAQRNLAYSLKETKPISSCAWRGVIIKLESKRVDGVDINNLKIVCSKLTQEALFAAVSQEEHLIKEINNNLSKE